MSTIFLSKPHPTRNKTRQRSTRETETAVSPASHKLRSPSNPLPPFFWKEEQERQSGRKGRKKPKQQREVFFFKSPQRGGELFKWWVFHFAPLHTHTHTSHLSRLQWTAFSRSSAYFLLPCLHSRKEEQRELLDTSAKTFFCPHQIPTTTFWMQPQKYMRFFSLFERKRERLRCFLSFLSLSSPTHFFSTVVIVIVAVAVAVVATGIIRRDSIKSLEAAAAL